MSQSKIKKLRKQQALSKVGIVLPKVDFLGIRQILIENWKFLVILLLGVVAVYINSLWGDFVSDDYAAIPNNPFIRTKWAGGSSLFLNLSNVANHLIAVVFNINSTIPFHVFSLFVYLLVIICSFVFLSIIFDGRIAKLTTVLFSFHPIHVEAVSWISGKPYLFLGLFQLCGYICLVMFLLSKKKKYIYGGVLVLILSFLSDKTRSLSFFFVAPIIVIFLAYLERFKNVVKKDLFWKIVGLASVFTFVMFLFLWPMVKNRIGEVNFGYKGDGSIFYNPFFQYPTAITKYLQLLHFPVDITLYHTMYVLPVWLNWSILLTYMSCVIYFWFKDKKLFFSLAFIFLTTAPSMAPVKVSWLTAERYIFLGSLGWCLFLTLVWQKYFSRFKILGPALLVFLISVFTVKTFIRNIDWQTNHNLWVTTVQVSPNSHNAWNNIGDDYDKLGQYDNAIKGFTQSTVMKPNYADAFHNRANIYFKTGRLELARESYEAALSFNPRLMQTYISLTQIDLNEGKVDLALEHSAKALEIDPNNFQVHYVRAVVLAEAGMKNEAIIEAEMLVKANPSFEPGQKLLIELRK